jgi:hypothetical protein
VEFEYCSHAYRGIVFKRKGGKLGVVCGKNSWFEELDTLGLERVGYTDVVSDCGLTIGKAYAIAEKYFSTPTQPYTPQVGDVVEFEYNGNHCEGIVYQSDNKEMAIVSEWGIDFYMGWDIAFFGGDVKNLRKIGYTDVIPETPCCSESIKGVFKAYFSTPTFTGTYAERQAQWVKHHDIKVGSKVKVVREFEANEDGCKCSKWAEWKAAVGSIVEVSNIWDKHANIQIGGWSFPYFVLEPVK